MQKILNECNRKLNRNFSAIFILGHDWKASSTDVPICLRSLFNFLAVSLIFLTTKNRDVLSANSLGEQQSSEGRSYI